MSAGVVASGVSGVAVRGPHAAINIPAMSAKTSHVFNLFFIETSLSGFCRFETWFDNNAYKQTFTDGNARGFLIQNVAYTAGGTIFEGAIR